MHDIQPTAFYHYKIPVKKGVCKINCIHQHTPMPRVVLLLDDMKP